MKVKFLNSLNKNTLEVRAYNKAVLAGRNIKPSDTTLSIENVDLKKIKRVAKLQKSIFAKAKINTKTHPKKTNRSKKSTSQPK